MSLIPDMTAYWKRPKFKTAREPQSASTLIDIFKFLVFSLGGVFAIMIAVGLLFQIMGLEHPDVSDDFAKASEKRYFIVFAVILAPFVEEMIFRSWLGVKWGVLLILPILLWCVGVIVFLQEKALPYTLDVACLIGLTILVGTYCVQYCRTATIEGYHEAVLERIFPFIFWATLFGFGLIHLSNFESNDLGVLSVLIVLPQIFIGGVLGYLRMRFGLITAILFHAAYNGVLVGLSLLVMPTVTGG